MKKIDFETIDSTSLYLKENYLKLDNFTFVSSLFQNNGKGRNTRVWESEKGENLLFSILIKESEIIEKFYGLSIMSACCVYNVLKKLNIKNVSIKWPNDIYINNKKVCGILLEGISNKNGLIAIIIGVGLNVNQKNFNIENATSIYQSTKKEIEINAIKELVYNEFIYMINKYKDNDNSYLKIARENNFLKDKEVYAYYLGNKVFVKVLDINDDNTLKVLYKDQIININSGEITFHKDEKDPY